MPSDEKAVSLLESQRLAQAELGADAFAPIRASLAGSGAPPRPVADQEIQVPEGGGDPWQNWKSPTNRLVRRITMGLDAREAARAAKIGYAAYLEEQLNPGDDSSLDELVAKRWPRTVLPVSQLYGRPDDYLTMLDLMESTLYRAVATKRQLEARMVEFWCDHFNVWILKSGGALMVPFVQDVIRRNALTSFPQLLRLVIGSPAMLVFLDNQYNYGYHANINFGREILELHTLSVDAGYVPEDIKSLARALTGWSVDEGLTSPAKRGHFVYRPQYHYSSNKWVYGGFVPAGQQDEGETVVAYLGNHPKTAAFIAKKLVRWFVSHDPDPGLVARVADVFLATGGDIKSMLREILKPENIVSAPAKLKRPFHLVTSALRATNAHVDRLEHLMFVHLEAMGQLPFMWEPPDGYPDRLDFWAASMRGRLQLGFSLANDEVYGVRFQPTGRPDSMTISDVVKLIDGSLFGGEMSDYDRGSLVSYLTRGGLSEQKVRGAYAIALSSPSFQWY